MRIRLLAAASALALALTGCVFSGGDTITVFAEFEDVIDLTTGASVRAGDVPVGTIEAITLTDDRRARVEMTVDADVARNLPSDTAAWLSKTSLLGERFVDLRPVGSSGQLEDGVTLADTRIVTDFEDLVGTGSDVLAQLAADRLATAIQAGAEAVGGRGALISQVIADVQLLVERYGDNSDTLTRLIDELALLTASLAPDAEANAADLVLLRETTEALDAQDEQLFRTLSDLQRLATVGERILEDHEGDIDNSIRRLRKLLEAVNEFEGKLDEVIRHLPGHNLNTSSGAINELTQIWGDFLICGSEGEMEGDPSTDCTPDNVGEQAPPPEKDPCPQPQVRCPDEVER